METILYLSANLVHIYAIYIYFGVFLGESRCNSYLKLSSFLGYYIINSAVFLCFDSTLLNLLTNILPLVIISMLYNKSLGQKIFCVLSSCAVGMFLDLLFFSIFSDTSMLVKNDIIQFILFLAFVFFIKHFVKQKETKLKSNHIWFIALISLGTIVIGQLTIDKFNIKSFVVAWVLLFINFLNFYMYDRELKNIQLQHTLKMIEASNHAYQNQLELMSESQKKIRFLKHDMKNHMYKIKKLISTGDCIEAERYVNEMAESMSVDNEFVNTGNKDVDCLLNYKLSIAKEMGTDFICEAHLPEHLIITSLDITTILGNLLDNALNALKHTQNKSIIILIKYSKGIVNISIENTFNSEYEQNKTIDQEHGLGLLSVEQTLKKYHGFIKRNQTDTKYHVDIFMYNSLD